MALIMPFASVKLLEMINICVQRELNTVKKSNVNYIHVVTIGNY